MLAVPAACGFSPFEAQVSSLVCVVSAELGQWTLPVAMLPVKPSGHQSVASAAFLEKTVSLVCLLVIFRCRRDLNLQHGERKRGEKISLEAFKVSLTAVNRRK